MKNIMKKLKNKKGFTLIELIVVIAILGILAAVAIPQLNGFTESAKKNADHSTFAQIQNVVALAVANGKVLPSATDTTVVATVAASTGTVAFTGSAKVNATQNVTDVPATISNMFSKAPKFQMAVNQDITITFTIASTGDITYAVTGTNGAKADLK